MGDSNATRKSVNNATFQRPNRQETNVVPLQDVLTVEHVMPQSWQTSGHFSIDGMDDATRLSRQRLIQTFGNLTRLTQPLSSSGSNGPYLDYEKDGKPIPGKRTGFLGRLLVMSSYFQNPDIKQWVDADVSTRGAHLFEQARTLWPHPDVATDPELGG